MCTIIHTPITYTYTHTHIHTYTPHREAVSIAWEESSESSTTSVPNVLPIFRADEVLQAFDVIDIIHIDIQVVLKYIRVQYRYNPSNVDIIHIDIQAILKLEIL